MNASKPAAAERVQAQHNPILILIPQDVKEGGLMVNFFSYRYKMVQTVV